MKKWVPFLVILFAIFIIAVAAGVEYYFFDYHVPVQVETQGPFATTTPNETEKSASIGFAGDLMFDRQIRKVAEAHGYDFILANVETMLHRPDLVVANLEGPITTNPSISLPAIDHTLTGEDYTFTFAPVVATLLARSNIHIVAIGNNHILNFGPDDVDQTEKYLKEAGIDYFGDPSDPAKPLFFEKNGLCFAFISWNEFATQNVDQTLQEIKAASTKTDFVIVFAHWGVEYQSSPTPKMQMLAHSFIDTGADLVIGAHPHVIGTTAIYHGKHIYYSLGNFVFDQYFSPSVRCGLFLTATFGTSTINFTTQKIYLDKNGQTIPASTDQCRNE